MLTIVSDTHGTDGHRLRDHTLDSVRAADRVVHAGDFTTERVHDAFAREAAALTAVAGNNDEPALADRLPATATIEYAGLGLVVAHGHDHTATALEMLARQEEADVIVVGHSHRPELVERDGRLWLNPGSHADPRRYEPAHGEVERVEERVELRVRRPDGSVLAEACR